MRVAVTGAGGAAARAVIDALRARGDEVVTTDRDPASAEVLHAAPEDGYALARAFDGAAAVVHADLLPAGARSPYAAYAAINGEGTDLVLRMARRAGAAKAVVLSSVAVSGRPSRRPLREVDPPRPEGPFGRSLLAAEEACRRHAEDGFDVDVLRLAPLAAPTGRFALLFSLLARHLPVPAPFTVAWHLLAPPDLARAVLAALARPHPGAALTCQLGTLGPTSVGADLRALRDHAGSRSPILAAPEVLLPRVLLSLHHLGLGPLTPEQALPILLQVPLALDRARDALGFVPRFTNAQALGAAWDAWVAAGRPAAPLRPRDRDRRAPG